MDARDRDREVTAAKASRDAPPPTVDAAVFADGIVAAGTVTHGGAGAAKAATGPAPSGYEILAELGRGGMGVVYKARQVSLNRPVALKMILGGVHASEKDLARFFIEAEAVAALEHPNIVRIYEINKHDGRPYFTLEYLDGGSLADRLREGPLAAKVAAGLVKQLADGVAHAHAQGILHRDLKPANVLFTADGTPKIADFGLAKRLKARPDSDSGLTNTGAAVGTPSYMPPEQARGDKARIGPQADVYALGATLYAMLTGRAPFQGASVVDTLAMVTNQDPVPPSDLVQRLPRDLETICLKCLEKEPARRYASAQELATDLSRFLAGEPILARPIGTVERGVKWVRRRPAVAALLASLAAVICIAFGVVAGQLGVTRAALNKAESQTRERALAQVNALRHAAPGAVPGILDNLERDRADVLPKLRELWAEGGSEPERMRLALALLPVDPENIRTELTAWMLKADDPAEVLLARDALMPYKADLVRQLWTTAEDKDQPDAQRLRALAALAAFDPESPSWRKSGSVAAERLLASNPFYLPTWTTAFRPVRSALIKSLSEVHRGQKLAEHRNIATLILVDYAGDQPATLADLLMDADEKQFAAILPKFKERSAEGLAVLSREVELAPPAKAGNDVKEQLAKRQANAAVALLRLNQPARVWPLLKHSSDPRGRSYLIHRFAPLGADAEAIIQRLDEEKDPTVVRALYLALGHYDDKQLPEAIREALLPKLRHVYVTAPDAGLHAAVEWLLRTWKQHDWLAEINDDWAKDRTNRGNRMKEIRRTLASKKDKAPPQWLVTNEEHSLVVIPGPVEFLMGSPPTEKGRNGDEVQHRRRIARTFFISAKAVTLKQYRRFFPGHKIPAEYTWSPDLPVVGVNWYEAAAYCNWLSLMEGIPQSEWCYEVTPKYTRARPGYLNLKGYRLPTEAEMELATRAGSVTCRYYGETDDLLGEYAWYEKNADEKLWPVGLKKPNDFGLFDVQGNAFTWCHECHKPYPIVNEGEVVEDVEDLTEETNGRHLRGGSVNYRAAFIRSADRYFYFPSYRSNNNGFRVAKTLK